MIAIAGIALLGTIYSATAKNVIALFRLLRYIMPRNPYAIMSFMLHLILHSYRILVTMQTQQHSLQREVHPTADHT